MPKVSVIVPVYNVEAYLEKCVGSILAQTERDFELLLIDDGSTDGSGALCDALAGTDPRARVIHQENKGLGGARNTGIREAAGEWLLFVDSDDWIEPDILEKALACAVAQKADITAFGFRSVDEQGRELGVFRENLPERRAMDVRENKHVMLIAPCAWNKLYRKELFTGNGILYPPRVWYEDVRTTPKLIAASSRMAFLPDVGYNYVQRQGSIMNSLKVDRNVEILEAFEDLLSYFRELRLFEEYRDELCHLTLYHAYLTASVRVIRLNRKHPLIPRFAAFIKENFPDYRKDLYKSRLTGREKLLLFLLERRAYFLIDFIFKLKG